MDASDPNQQAAIINKVSALALEQQPNEYILLATAIMAVQGQTTQRENCRTFMDPGSHVQKGGRSTCALRYQYIAKCCSWTTGAGILVTGTCAAVMVKFKLSELDRGVYPTTTDGKPTVGIHR